jgi:quercetin dioxygenase-like cupin family protein
MIVPTSQGKKAVVEKAKGGDGQAEFLFFISDDNRTKGAKFAMAAEVTLQAGSSIGYHTHPTDEEIYFVTKGSGIYLENDRSEHPVSVGTLTFCPRGEGHGLINNTKEPLVIMAYIAE